jgi:tetratricopeptide (TPR) repeat protein
VAFGSANEYDAVRFNEFASAFYQPTADQDFIVMGPDTAGAAATAMHEYVHVVVRHSELHFPPWLNEGLAELYSTIRQTGDKVLVGALIPGRQRALAQTPWVRLADIVAADQNSPLYNEKNKAGSLYNEGWALTHMFALREDYAPKFPDFMVAVAAGADTAEAFRKVYDKTVAEVERDLLLYLRGERFQGRLIPMQMEKLTDKLEARPVPAFDLDLTLAEIQNRRGHEAESRSRFQELIARDGARSEPHAELAYLEWRSGKSKDALPEFEQAFALGARGSRFLWDYGRLAERDPARAIPVLAKLLEQEPDRLEVRMELAEVQLRARQPVETLRTLAPVRKVGKADAARLFHTVALAAWQAGLKDQARAAAENFRKVAESAVEKAEAESLLALIERP